MPNLENKDYIFPVGLAYFWRGAKIALTASPKIFQPRTKRKMAPPGNITVCQYSKGLPEVPKIQLRDRAMSWPQSAYPGGAPNPKKLKAAAVMTMAPMSKDATTKTG